MRGTISETRRRPAARLFAAVLAVLIGCLDALVEQFDAATLQLHVVEGRLADARTAAVLALADAAAAREVFGQRARLAYEGVGSGLDVVLGATTLSEFTDRLQFLN